MVKVTWTIPGARSYREMVGPRGTFDTMAAEPFSLLLAHGLREHHSLLDVGCGCLRLGRLLIPYLLPGRYCGLEPDEHLLMMGLRGELGEEILSVKEPTFVTDELEFNLRRFERRFDFVIASSVFMHQPARRIRACMKAASECLTKRGRFFASFRAGSKDHKGDRDVYPACTPYRRDTMLSMARSSGLRAEIMKRRHPRRQLWMLMTRR